MTGVFITINLLTCIADISNLTLVSNVCKAVPMSLFWASNKFNGLLEMHFEINLIRKLTWYLQVLTQILVHR